MSVDVPSQSTNCSEYWPLNCLTRIVYAVIGVPLSEGGSHETTRSPLTTVVTGAVGVSGTVAQRMETGSLSSE
jgi:hypothetical protein